jgi:hypothetical protein
MAKCVCSYYRCNWHGDSDEVLRAKNPFDDSDDIEGCPKCKEIGSVVQACDEPGCWKEVTCGTPTPDGYRSTCGEHSPKVPNT